MLLLFMYTVHPCTDEPIVWKQSSIQTPSSMSVRQTFSFTFSESDAFELWCWRGLLRVPWTARRYNLKEISSEYSLEGLMLKLKLQIVGHLMWRTDVKTHLKRPWCWEGLKAGERDKRGWDGWMAPPTQWTWVWVSSGSWWWTGRPGMLQSMGLKRVGYDWATELNWTEFWTSMSQKTSTSSKWGLWLIYFLSDVLF